MFALVRHGEREACVQRLMLAQVGVAAWMSLYLATRDYGLGLHIEDVPVEDLSQFLYVSRRIPFDSHQLTMVSYVT